MWKAGHIFVVINNVFPCQDFHKFWDVQHTEHNKNLVDCFTARQLRPINITFPLLLQKTVFCCEYTDMGWRRPTILSLHTWTEWNRVVIPLAASCLGYSYFTSHICTRYELLNLIKTPNLPSDCPTCSSQMLDPMFEMGSEKASEMKRSETF